VARQTESYTVNQLKEIRHAEFYPRKDSIGGWIVGDLKIPVCNDITALLFAFRHSEFSEEKEYLFWEIADRLWNKGPEESDHMMRKNKWSWKMIHEACRNKYLSIGGAGSSGKSYVIAGWCLVNWLCAPEDTMVLFTSTDLGGAKKRIWGAAMKLLQAVPWAPAKYRESIGVVAYTDGNKISDTAGIQLIASDKGTAKLGKMIGIKAARVFLCADELTDISPNVQSAAVGNLSKNPTFQMIGLGNPSSRLDPFGIFSMPKEGWESVDVLVDYEWTTRLNGKYVRISSEDSPNIDQTPNAEYPVGGYYPYLPTEGSLAEALENMGTSPEEARKSREWLRFNAAVFFDQDEEDNVYSENEIIRSGAMLRLGDDKEIHKKIHIASCDPSFSQGGDNTVLTFMDVGYDQYAQNCLKYKEHIYLYEDVTNVEEPRNLQIAKKIKKECEKRGVKPEDFGIDASGAGGGLADMIALVWSPLILRVQFGGAASDRKLKHDTSTTAKDRYGNRASELFFAGKHYLMGRQLSGIPEVVVGQMCGRRYDMTKGTKGMVLHVESKRLYKARVGKSPDELDSYLVGIELARERHLFMPLNPPLKKMNQEKLDYWLSNRRSLDTYAADRVGFVGNLGA